MNQRRSCNGKEKGSLICRGKGIGSFLCFGQCSYFCVDSDVIMGWSCFCFACSVALSDIGVLWSCWYSTRPCCVCQCELLAAPSPHWSNQASSCMSGAAFLALELVYSCIAILTLKRLKDFWIANVIVIHHRYESSEIWYLMTLPHCSLPLPHNHFLL